MCRVKGKSVEQCQNYIRVLKLQAPDSLFVCGTNAYKPKCRTYAITVSILSPRRSDTSRSVGLTMVDVDLGCEHPEKGDLWLRLVRL